MNQQAVIVKCLWYRPLQRYSQASPRSLGWSDIHHVCSSSRSVSTVPSNNPPKDWAGMFDDWVKKYQQLIGISEVLELQENVTKLTDKLIEAQASRRQFQLEVDKVHQDLLATQKQITKSELYSADHISLLERVGPLNAKLKELQEASAKSELDERTTFTRLSSAIKHCHEKERTQAENTKYWSILISVVSAALASLITSINNWMRIKQIKDHSSQLHKDTLLELGKLVAKIEESNKTTEPPAEFISELKQPITETIQKPLDIPIDHSSLIPEPNTPKDQIPLGTVAISAFGGLVIGSILGSRYIC